MNKLVFLLLFTTTSIGSAFECATHTTQTVYVSGCNFTAFNCLSKPQHLEPIVGCTFTAGSLSVNPRSSKYFDSSIKKVCRNATFLSLWVDNSLSLGKNTFSLQTFVGSMLTLIPNSTNIEVDYGFSCGDGIARLSCQDYVSKCTFKNVVITFYTIVHERAALHNSASERVNGL